jgi:hypothetical protein
MKFLKYSSLGLLIVLFALFLFFGVNYQAGYHYPPEKECRLTTGYSKVYVHWLAPLNNTLSNFCDGSLTPRYYESDGGCNCTE